MTETRRNGLRIISGSAHLPGDYSPRAKRDEAPAISAAMWTMRIPLWMPTPLNRLIGGHWAKGAKLKKQDREIVALAVQLHRVPPAEHKRRLSVLIVLPKGKRACDPDALQKSLADALVHAAVLRNDSHLWVEHQPVEFARGERLCTYVTLEDT